ncbi:MAG: hypothetical protein IJU91_02540 [Selenomonadaceae bacterium]|nr:hypothetical protein [Selenomonadaceae bacterium]
MADAKKVELTEENLGGVAGGAGKTEKKDTKVTKKDDKKTTQKTTPQTGGDVFNNDNRGGKQINSQQGKENQNKTEGVEI